MKNRLSDSKDINERAVLTKDLRLKIESAIAKDDMQVLGSLIRDHNLFSFIERIKGMVDVIKDHSTATSTEAENDAIGVGSDKIISFLDNISQRSSTTAQEEDATLLGKRQTKHDVGQSSNGNGLGEISDIESDDEEEILSNKDSKFYKVRERLENDTFKLEEVINNQPDKDMIYKSIGDVCMQVNFGDLKWAIGDHIKLSNRYEGEIKEVITKYTLLSMLIRAHGFWNWEYKDDPSKAQEKFNQSIAELDTRLHNMYVSTRDGESARESSEILHEQLSVHKQFSGDFSDAELTGDSEG